MDIEAYERRVRSGPCFICALVAGDPDYDHERVYEDEAHVAFLDAYPTLRGRVLVAPKRHVEHVVRDLDEDAFLRLLGVVRRVALAVERAVPTERTYLLSLGSQQGNAHLHWHVAPPAAGRPVRAAVVPCAHVRGRRPPLVGGGGRGARRPDPGGAGAVSRAVCSPRRGLPY